ncbi:type II secretion system protein N [Phaeobacter italicus]|uniref:type II secretion system protein N n=1 Tax=Phaeobacter italicus TaxID=481446 RepID=UPI00248D8439|nr:type II secretion system protein N [Phaeobacter italicus]
MSVRHVWIGVGCVWAILLGSLVWSAVPVGFHLSGHTTVVPQDMSAPAFAQPTATSVDLDAIVAFAPFGASASEQPVAARRMEDVELDILLRGVLWDVDPMRSRAFLDVRGRVDVYRVGDLVHSAELVSIETDAVTVRSGEVLVTVGFEGAQKGSQLSEGEGGSVEDETASSPFARLAAAIVPGQGSIELRAAPPPETTDDYINLWRDRITRNPQSAMERIGVELVENGYRVKTDPNIGVTLAGLRPGDVITHLNGQSVGDVEKDRQLYDDVAASGMARLEVLRDGRSLLLTFPLR